MKKILIMTLAAVAAFSALAQTRSKQASQAWVEMKLAQLDAKLSSALDNAVQNITNEQSLTEAAADFANFTLGEISAIQAATFYATSAPTTFTYKVVSVQGTDVPTVGMTASGTHTVNINDEMFSNLGLSPSGGGKSWYINENKLIEAAWADHDGNQYWNIYKEFHSSNGTIYTDGSDFVLVFKEY